MNDLALADGIEYVFQNGEWLLINEEVKQNEPN